MNASGITRGAGRIVDTNKWIFQGLKVQLNNAGVSHSFWLMLVQDGGPSFPVTDIIFDGMDISSADSLAGFTTQAQLQTFDNGISIEGNVPDPISTTTYGSPQSFWNKAVTPTQLSASQPAAASGLELGTTFKSSVAGAITGLNFYKSPNDNSTVHVGNLWDATGAHNLGTVTFTNETASGWQTANFATPIPIAAGA